MKIFPAVHYSMGGLWVDYERTADGRPGRSARRRTRSRTFPACTPSASATISITAPTAWGPTRCLSCIFSGLIVAPGIETLLKSLKGRRRPSSRRRCSSRPASSIRTRHDALLKRPGGGENPYLIHQELGDVMTKAATVVRHNDQLREAYGKVCELYERAEKCSLSDTGNWTNQNVVFTKALLDMFPLALTILKGALQRDECRGAHFKPDFAMPGIEADRPGRAAPRRRRSGATGSRRTPRKWLKIDDRRARRRRRAEITYEDVDTSLIPPAAAAVRPGRRRR